MVVIRVAAPKCPRCAKSVYAAEGVTGPEGLWHKTCFRCRECRCALDTATMAEHDSEVYCRNCHKKLFSAGANPTRPAENSSMVQPSAINAQPATEYATWRGSPTQPPALPHCSIDPVQSPPRTTRYKRTTEMSPSSVFSSGRRRIELPTTKDICPRCTKRIYHAEKVVGPGGAWHRGCFKCKQCNSALSSTTLTEHNGEAFCRTCYTKLFSLRGYNVGGSLEPVQGVRSRGSSVETIYRGMSPVPRSVEFPATETRSSSASGETSPFSGAVSPFGSVVSAAASAAVAAHGTSRPVTPLSSTMASRPASSRSSISGLAYGRTFKPKTFGASIGGGYVPPDRCPRCSDTIYAAEMGMAAGRKYHKKCIRCKACSTSIGSLQIHEHDGDIFCKQCYARDFGPKGFRQSLGPSINDY
ncbi:hypothetical protein BX661DRAFT_101258 [Kickxella alabastrina]|uniref:uncharacterized protein n=1 Tax=Kickxella alabastrina TaxID=61397 RepID=UPI002220EEAC|nr:uncharacterized protein BX661DRAFT_101258 [Kickxella alabastrina]KAI7829215.1 hypothetical protein BX661DRAFT_101258 [Kickxella alabastrina]